MTARMNISLPDDLKTRMDALAQPVNWSGVAARAYEAKLEELAPASSELSLAAVAERLRASREEFQRQQRPEPEPNPDRYGEGLLAGMSWGRESSEWVQLIQLQSLCGTAGPTDWQPKSPLIEEAQLALSGQDRATFWTQHAGEAEPPARFVHGFVDGALTIFESVQKLL